MTDKTDPTDKTEDDGDDAIMKDKKLYALRYISEVAGRSKLYIVFLLLVQIVLVYPVRQE